MKTLQRLLLVIGIILSALALPIIPKVLADCTPEGTSGADTIVCTGNDSDGASGDTLDDTITVDPGAVVDGYYAIDGGDGQDTITVNEGAEVTGIAVGINGGESNDTIIVNGGTVTGETTAIFGGGGDDTITIQNGGVVNGEGGIEGGSGNDTIVVGSGASVNANVIAVSGGGDNDTIVIGEGATVEGIIGVYDVEGDGTLIVESGATINASSPVVLGTGDNLVVVEEGATLYDTGGGNTAIMDNSGGDNTIINNGSIYGGAYGINTAFGNDVVQLGNNSSTTGGFFAAVATNSGNDTIVLGSGSITYGVTCGNIVTTNVVHGHAPTVEGLLDGGGDHDTLVFNYFTDSQEEADAMLASLQNGSGSGEWEGKSFEWTGIENIRIGGVYSVGITRLYDDGVLLAFPGNGGIDICSGEAGMRVATIDFAALDAGQYAFSNGGGWWVSAVDIGGGTYEVHLFDASGVERINDANGDGVADSRFTFQR